MAFAFFSTLYREIIKDLEDLPGDKAFNCRTLPIVFGVKTGKQVALVFGSVLFILLVFAVFLEVKRTGSLNSLFLIIAVLMPLSFSFFYLLKANEKQHYRFLSKFAKWIMIGGIFYLLFV